VPPSVSPHTTPAFARTCLGLFVTGTSTDVGVAVCQRPRSHGVLLRPLGDVVVLIPPLAMSDGNLAHITTAIAAEVAGL
jgi:adenosylmethionine-8-amino-7-oxononanoate aminotransferase